MNIVEELLKIALLGSAWVLYLLLFLSVLSIGVMFERFLFFFRNSRRGGDGLRARLLKALGENDADGIERLLRDSGTVEGGVVATAYVFREGGSRAFADALESELSRVRKILDRGMNFLGTLGNNAPFIGLFGTVIGVIVSFHELGSASARAGAMGGVMSGISEALVATGVGLFVALPAVIAYNVAQKRIGDIEADAMSLGRLVAAWLETRERGGSLRPAGGSSDRATDKGELARASASDSRAGHAGSNHAANSTLRLENGAVRTEGILQSGLLPDQAILAVAKE